MSFSSNRRYYPALDGLRTVAIAIVMIAHAHASLFRAGGVGVDIFFALSGFLISSILLAEFEKYGSINLFNFYVRRSIRLMPCLVLAILYVGIERRIATGSWPVQNLLLSLGYVMNWARSMQMANHFPLGHTWSLAIEEQFYLVWPLVIIATCRVTASPRNRLLLLLGLGASLMAYRCGMSHHFSADRLYYGSDTHCDGLVLGSALAFFVAMLPAGRLEGRPSWWVGRVLAPMSVLTVAGIIVRSIAWESAMGRFCFIAMSLSAVTIVMDIVAGSHSLLRPLLSHKAAIWMGQISYGLYLWHLPIYHTLMDLNIHNVWIAKLTIGIPVSIGVAALSFYTVERKILSLKDRFVRKQPLFVPATVSTTEDKGWSRSLAFPRTNVAPAAKIPA